jgi:hypothetical protein
MAGLVGHIVPQPLASGPPALHAWVFGGPWDCDEEPKGEATGEDKRVELEHIGVRDSPFATSSTTA